MRHAAVIVDTNGGHQVVPLDDDVSKNITYIKSVRMYLNIFICIRVI